jgi:sporulation protein YhbH
MTIRDYSRETGGQRSGRDRKRHRDKCREAIRKGLARMVAEQDIIGADRKGKKASFRIRAFPEYRFTFGRKADGVGSGSEQNRGATFRTGKGEIQKSGPGAAGSEPGEDVYEVEVTLDDIDAFLFDDLELPDFLVKQLRQIPVPDRGGMTGISRYGTMSRLHRRGTVRTRLRRVQSEEFVGHPVEPGFIDDDLRFRRLAERVRMASNAVLICMMDVSGSMDDSKKFLARIFFWLLYRFVQSKYEHAELVFITHHATAREVGEEEFFHTMESGGTIVSSAYELALETIDKRYPPDEWNIYAFHISDGDNWQDDNRHVLEMAKRLLECCNLFGYGQVNPTESFYFPVGSAMQWSTVFDVLKQLQGSHSNIGFVKIEKKEDVYPQFRELMTREKLKGGVRGGTP